MGAGMTMNGMGGQQVKYLLDGVPIVGRLDGNIDLGQLSLVNVDRIEIVNGPMSGAYGTDAAGGVINIITEKSVDHPFETTAAASYESSGRYDTQIYAGIQKNRSSVRASFERFYFDGWAPDDVSRDVLWNPKEQYGGQLTFRQAGNHGVWGLNSSVGQETLKDKGAARISPYEAYAFDKVYTTTRSTQQLYVDQSIARKARISGSLSYVYWQRIRNTYRKDLVTLDQTTVAGLEEQDTNRIHSIHARATYSVPSDNEKWSWLFGTENSLSYFTGKRINGQEANEGDYALFASAEWSPINKIQLKPAIRYGYHTGFETPLIPSLALRYEISNKTIARLSYGRGFRAPSIKERYLFFVDVNHNVRGNENLQPEDSHNFYGSIDYGFVFSNNRKLLLVAKGFHNQINNVILLAQPESTSNLYTYVNGTSSTVGGAGLQSKWTQKRISIGAHWTVTGTESSFITGSAPMNYVHEFGADAGVQIGQRGLMLNLFFKHNGKSTGYVLNADNSLSAYDNQSYNLLDITFSKPFWNKRIQVSGGIKNLMNVTDVNATIQGSAHNDGSGTVAIGTGRTAFAKLTIHFSQSTKNRMGHD
jgi:outer membrane receptor for ferrienterochelin and colicins